jgi:hypothetical protein
MNQDAKEFLKLALLSIIPSVFFFGVLALLAVMCGCSASHDLGYVIEDQNGVQVVCKDYKGGFCGLHASGYDDGLERKCITNVKIRKVEP